MRPSRPSRLAPLAALLSLALASPALALGIGDVELLSFPSGGANTGFTNAGPGFDFATNPMTERVCAGAGVFQAVGAACMGLSSYELTITQNLQTVHQFPQAHGADPTAGAPFIADSLWTATNTSQEAWPDLLLLFSAVNRQPFPGALVNGYPDDIAVGLDGNLLDIVKYTAGGQDYFYGAVNLGTLAPGESRQFTVRYIVSSGPMPLDKTKTKVVMPPLKLVAQVVPEPGTFALLLTGLAGFGIAGRKR